MIGFLTPRQINSVSIRIKQNKTVKDVMMPLQDIIKINSDELLLDVIKDRGKNDESEIPVIENGNCIGILNHNNILQFIFELHKLGH